MVETTTSARVRLWLPQTQKPITECSWLDNNTSAQASTGINGTLHVQFVQHTNTLHRYMYTRYKNHCYTWCTNCTIYMYIIHVYILYITHVNIVSRHYSALLQYCPLQYCPLQYCPLCLCLYMYFTAVNHMCFPPLHAFNEVITDIHIQLKINNILVGLWDAESHIIQSSEEKKMHWLQLCTHVFMASEKESKSNTPKYTEELCVVVCIVTKHR